MDVQIAKELVIGDAWTSGFEVWSESAPSLCVVAPRFRIADHPEVGQTS